MKEKIVCGLDIGSTKVALSLVKSNGVKKEILFNDLAEHSFIKNDSILDVSLARDVLKKIFVKAAKTATKKVNTVFVNVDGPKILEVMHSRAVMPLNEGRGKVVSSQDINKVDSYAKALASEVDKEVVHQFPQYYSIDNKIRTLKIKGLFARKIGVDLLIARASSAHINNIFSLINSVGYDVDEVYFSGVALKKVFFDDNDSENALNTIIDIGGSYVTISFFNENVLSDVEFVSSGSNILVDKIKEKLKLSEELALEILKSHGAAFSQDVNESENIVIKKTTQYQTIKRKDLVVLLEPELKELLVKIKAVLSDKQFIRNAEAMNKTILTGRICLMDGFLELAEKILQTPVDLGRSNSVSISTQKLPIFSTSIGLALCATEEAQKEKIAFSPNKFSGFLGRVKEVYQDYF